MSRIVHFIGAVFCVVALLSACASAGPALAVSAIAETSPRYPAARLAVIGDPHVYDIALGVAGPAFAAATSGARVLYGLSAELFAAAVDRIIDTNPDFVLIPGDLTKDGERASHDLVLRQLGRLKAAGIAAYVIPGNHDIDNPRARRFDGAKAEAVASVLPGDFAALYADFGYGQAVARDPVSLSYALVPVPGLRLLALDPFQYPEGRSLAKPEPLSRFRAETLDWAAAQLAAADRAGEATIVMLHQSLLDHFDGQAAEFPDSLPGNREALLSLLAAHQVGLVFTGHFHIQDIAARAIDGGRTLYDAATAALAGFPLVFRQIELSPDGTADFSIERIDSVPAWPEDLASYADDFIRLRIARLLQRQLGAYGCPAAEASAIAQRYASAYAAFAAGDEQAAPGSDAFPSEIRSLVGRLAALRFSALLRSLWRDAPPADNEAVLRL